MGASAVVFAYHDVGVRCLAVLLAHGVQVPRARFLPGVCVCVCVCVCCVCVCVWDFSFW